MFHFPIQILLWFMLVNKKNWVKNENYGSKISVCNLCIEPVVISSGSK